MASSSFYSGTGVTPDNTDVDPVVPNNITAIEDSKNAAALSEAAAAASAAASATSAASGATSATTATTKASESAASATASAASAAASEVSNVASGVAKVASETAKTAAETARDAAIASEVAAAAAEVAAETAETNAATSEAAALSSKNAAATSASTASTKATESASSASASQSARVGSVAAQAAAETAETNAETAQAASETAKTASEAAKVAAQTAETNASTSAATATTQAGIATTKAGEAATSATASEASKVAAAASQVASSNSQVSAASSAASAAAVFDQFDDTYLGSKTSEPTVDNDGNALVTGALFYNSSTGSMFIWDGTEWIAASAAGGVSLANFAFTATAGQTSFSGSDDNSNTLVYTQNNLILILNGVILEAGTDYTATDGSTIVLTDATVVNDELNVVAFKTFTTADMVSSSNGGTFYSNVDFSAGIDVTGDITASGDVITSELVLQDSNGVYATNTADARVTFKAGNTTAAEMGFTNTTSGQFVVRNKLDGDMRFRLETTSKKFRFEDTTGNNTLVTINNNGMKIGGGNGLASEALDIVGNIAVTGTVDGRDVSTDGTKLDGIEAAADVTDTTNVAAAGALMDSEVTNLAQVKAFDTTDFVAVTGDTMTGDLNITGTLTSDGLTVDGNTLYVDAANNRVGIGTSSPVSAIHASGLPTDGILGTFATTAGTYGSKLAIDQAGVANWRIGQPAGVDAFAFYGFGAGSYPERARLDASGNFGIGVSDLSTWSLGKALHIGNKENNLWGEADYAFHMNQNAYYNGGWKYSHTDEATQYTQADGQHIWSYAPSGTLNTALTWSEAMRLTAAGGLLVGTTSASIYGTTTTGINLIPDGATSFNRYSGQAAMFNRISSDGDIVQFRKDGSTVGSIGTQYGYLGIGTQNTGIYLHPTIPAVVPCDPSSAFVNRDSAIDIGVSNVRFKDLYLSGGVYLGGTGSANHLDDYESGDVDITNLTFTNSGSAVANSNYDTLRYVKIGDQVSLTGNLYFDSVTSQNGNLKIPLPFANGGGDQKHRTTCLVGNFQNTSVTVLKIEPSQSYGQLVFQSGWGNVAIAAGHTYVFNITYFTN